MIPASVTEQSRVERSRAVRRLRRTGGLVVGALVAALLAPVPATGDSTERPPRDPHSLHSSDGVVGPIAEPLPTALRRVAVRSAERSYRVVPGLRYLRWDETDARGRVRVHLLCANLRKPRLSLRYAAPDRVASRAKLSRILREDGAIAGVNGDFFDIDDTGAPLGVGVDQRRVLHGSRQDWLHSFVVSGRAATAVGELPVRAKVVRGPRLPITNVNSPHVVPHGVGLYTRRWGANPGYAVTDGARRRDVRQVVVRGGKVVSNQRRVDAGSAIRGQLLIGRGRGAVRLNRRWPVGTRLRLDVVARRSPRVAIGGSQQLLGDGRLMVTDDGQLHPRTAVGVDRDTDRLLIVVVDGRQRHSRGLTLLELAELLRGLGAEDALNLDGGGSSTMVARRPSGRVRVANSPSGGVQRPVPNGLELVYRRP